jgi:NAD dependent epimerase/dehydratase family enzyme
MGSGKQYISWITLDDLLRAIVFILENDTIQGPVNFTTPNPVTNEEFNHLLAKAIKRPLFLKMPEFLVRKIFGEMGQALFLDSTKAYPKALLDHGFKFLYPNIKDAFNHFFNK